MRLECSATAFAPHHMVFGRLTAGNINETGKLRATEHTECADRAEVTRSRRGIADSPRGPHARDIYRFVSRQVTLSGCC